jgi:Putative MetA-pathway of phenol degradation
MRRRLTVFAESAVPSVAIAVLLLRATIALAGPPFLTDDPVPVDHLHAELNVFSTYDDTHGGSDTSLPAMELNYGALAETQLHIGIPYVHSRPDGGRDEQGIGDLEVGAKYRFVQESERSPQIAVYPMAVLPTGDSKAGLGNGKTYWRLPVWLQKSWGAWTTYGGGGYVLNPADGQKNYAFGGWLLQKDFGAALTLGGEVYARGVDAVGGQATTILNVGGSYRFTPDFSLLVSAGHSVDGESHTIAYLGLLWSFGNGGNAGRAKSDFPAPPR